MVRVASGLLLRDHARDIVEVVLKDLSVLQSQAEQLDNSKGLAQKLSRRPRQLQRRMAGCGPQVALISSKPPKGSQSMPSIVRRQVHRIMAAFNYTSNKNPRSFLTFVNLIGPTWDDTPALRRSLDYQTRRVAPAHRIMSVPDTLPNAAPAGISFSTNTKSISAAIQIRFMIPLTNNKAISNQQHPTQKAPWRMPSTKLAPTLAHKGQRASSGKHPSLVLPQ